MMHREETTPPQVVSESEAITLLKTTCHTAHTKREKNKEKMSRAFDNIFALSN